MAATKKPAGKLVATLGELEHGTSKKFTMRAADVTSKRCC
jgi:hypothetical protein